MQNGLSGGVETAETCLQCNRLTKTASSRLVQDSCGHKKCRVCLLEDEEGCKQCLNQVEHKTVITCNGEVHKTKNHSLVSNNTVEEVKEQKSEVNVKPKRKKKVDDKRAYNSIVIPSHVTVNLDPLSYHCSICDKSFLTKAHVKYHTYCAGVKPHTCPVCQKEFILKVRLEVHMLKHTGAKPFSCSTCGKSFSEKAKLTRHNLCHSNEYPHICATCGKRFKSKESLHLHSITHRGDKPFSCKICDAKFNNSSNLKKHLVSHSRDKTHMCDECGKRFKLKWSLQVHRKSHLRVKEHKCEICFKAFTNNKELQRHNLIHSETKAFVCSGCNTSFRRKDNLHRHIKNTHPGTKAQIITKLPEKKPVDNPNAIKVITSSPIVKKENDRSSVINGPPKLAFKTPAFKNNYNIQRESTPKTQEEKERDRVPSAELCQKILSPYSTPLHYETSFQNRKHAMIKNIKFKVPIQYTVNSGRVPEGIKPVRVESGGEEIGGENNTYAELKTAANVAATSVIVNNALQSYNMHWRRRTAQNLNLKN